MGKTKQKMTPCQLYKAKKITRSEYDKRIGSTRASAKSGYRPGNKGRKGMVRNPTKMRNDLRQDVRGLKLELTRQRAKVKDMERILGRKV